MNIHNSIIHNSEKCKISLSEKNTSLSIDEQIKMWYIIIREYYSAIKSIEVLLHTIAWMSLENIQSEKSQSQRTTDSMINLYKMPSIGTPIEAEGR